ncbi:hypothetical protein BG011_007624 [Mortierella polycephala]|uniref:Uncharacterized protein n=1 Tax=Mortierella polycephala TaxID=41804 RepID=A0A9P6TYG2_9FUNG|nr:hypothetical protein BG011_007624 [Mortierella polycephala]
MTIQNKTCDSTFVVKYMNQMGRADKFGLLASNIEEAAVYKSITLNIYFEIYSHFFAAKVPIHEVIQDPDSEFNTQALPQFIACHEC